MKRDESREDSLLGGLYWVAMAAIIGILAVAAFQWLNTARSVYQFGEELRLGDRRAKEVGAVERPALPVKLIVQDRGCVKIEKAEYTGEQIVSYIRNKCSWPVCFVEFKYKAKAPNGTVIHSDYNYATTQSLNHGERVESTISVPIDDRLSSIELSVRASTDVCH